jgi:hypothetical protein
LLDLFNQVPNVESIESVSGDSAYGSQKSLTANAEGNAEAIIPVRKNGKPWQESSARNKTLPATKRLGRAIC